MVECTQGDRLQLDCPFSQTDNGLVVESRAVVEIECFKFIQILHDEVDTILGDPAPLDLQSTDFPHPHGNQSQTMVIQPLASIYLGHILLKTKLCKPFTLSARYAIESLVICSHLVRSRLMRWGRWLAIWYTTSPVIFLHCDKFKLVRVGIFSMR